VLSIGLAMALAAIALLTFGAVTTNDRIAPFDEASAEQMEAQVAALVAAGASEEQVRALVRDAMRLGRS
jgi:cytochrome c-type biogenesis protein CcmH/NrfF